VRGLFSGLAIVAVAGGVLAVLVVQSPDLSAQSSSQARTSSRTLVADADLQRDPPAARAESRRWRLASQFPITLPETGTLLAETIGRIETLNAGSLRLDVTEPKDIAQPLDLFDAVAGGAFDAAFIWPATIKGRTAAFEIFGGIPFGPKAAEFLAWHEKTGRALRDELYRAQNVHGMLCGMVAAGGTWFRKDVKEAPDIDRLPIVAFGLAGRTLAQFGAYPVTLAPAAIGKAYKEQKIVGAAFLSPVVDRQVMRGSDAKRYAFPSWSQHWAGLDLIVNLETWTALPARKRQVIENICQANLATSLAQSEAAQYDVLKDMIKDGIDVRRLPGPMVASLRTAWSQVNDSLQRDDPEFRRVWLSLAAFNESHALWRELTDTNPHIAGKP
jgi:TRAP-type mannitol/chloroaromatic compound transport system substrate-binding protein